MPPTSPSRARTGEFISTPAQDVALHVLCEHLQKIQQQAEIAGLFIGDRELLDCAHCGLQEDVLIDVLCAPTAFGKTVTAQR